MDPDETNTDLEYELLIDSVFMQSGKQAFSWAIATQDVPDPEDPEDDGRRVVARGAASNAVICREQAGGAARRHARHLRFEPVRDTITVLV